MGNIQRTVLEFEKFVMLEYKNRKRERDKKQKKRNKRSREYWKMGR